MKPNYYAIIPANVRYSNLKPNAKLLYGEITALSNKEGYCFASNKYFATLYGVTKNTISNWVSQLNAGGFVNVEIIKEGQEIIERRIAITQKEDTPITKKKDYNSTSINTTNNISNREMKFGILISEQAQGIFTADEANEFRLYWSELNKSESMMRWELERTWDLKSRMKRWKANTLKWTKPKQKSKLKQKLNTFNNARELINKINSQ
tara:strand:+ start:747 stop:1370 length:624 start_codon:yes stop_codon:yes gene_type:complete